MSTTQIEEKNKEEARNKPLVLDSGAISHYYPTAFKARRGPNNGRSQGDRITIANGSEVHIPEFKNEFNRLVFYTELKEASITLILQYLDNETSK